MSVPVPAPPFHGYVGLHIPDAPWMPSIFAQCQMKPCRYEHSHGTSSGYWPPAEVERIKRELFVELALHLATVHGIWEPAIERDDA